MNPQFDNTPGLHLPQPSMDYVQGQSQSPVSGASSPAAPHSEANPQAQTTGPALAPDGVQSAVSSPRQAAIGVADGKSDKDNDVSDEEWVSRAKDVIEQYQGDPYAQSRELSKLRTQFLKVRYDKDIKPDKYKLQ